MNWKEFKEKVEDKMEEDGIGMDEELQGIEVRDFDNFDVQMCGNFICDTGFVIVS